MINPNPASQQDLDTFRLIERISRVLRTEERKRYAAVGLQPVHGQVLEYLAKCNKYSNTHAAVAEYLGLTKGTVSTSIQILERKNLLAKNADAFDGRVFHIYLTKTGQALIDNLRPLDIFKEAESKIAVTNFYSIDQALSATLGLLQEANNSKSFGLCRSCIHFAVELHHYQCNLTNEALDRNDTEKICRDHEPTSPTNDQEYQNV